MCLAEKGWGGESGGINARSSPEKMDAGLLKKGAFGMFRRLLR